MTTRIATRLNEGRRGVFLPLIHTHSAHETSPWPSLDTLFTSWLSGGAIPWQFSKTLAHLWAVWRNKVRPWPTWFQEHFPPSYQEKPNLLDICGYG